MTPRAADGSELVRPQLIVPAYFHPATHPDQWAWLAERAAEIRMIVLNLAISFAVPSTAWQDHVGGLVTGALLTAAYAYVADRPDARSWAMSSTATSKHSRVGSSPTTKTGRADT